MEIGFIEFIENGDCSVGKLYPDIVAGTFSPAVGDDRVQGGVYCDIESCGLGDVAEVDSLKFCGSIDFRGDDGTDEGCIGSGEGSVAVD